MVNVYYQGDLVDIHITEESALSFILEHAFEDGEPRFPYIFLDDDYKYLGTLFYSNIKDFSAKLTYIDHVGTVRSWNVSYILDVKGKYVRTDISRI